MVSALLLAAGSGSRMKRRNNKIYLRVGGRSLLQWCLIHMLQVEAIREIVVVVAAGEEMQAQAEIDALAMEGTIPIHIVRGGATRQESVYRGLRAATRPDIVLVHDGARPLASAALYERVLEATRTAGAVVPGLSVVDTIKVVQEGRVEQTLPRSVLQRVQTPQGFRYDLLFEAHENALYTGLEGTDDASLVEYFGHPVHVVEGEPRNRKITTPEDLVLARHYVGVTPMRIGYGYDVHRLVEGRPCILGGVHIESRVGPEGHSDADVVLHAVMDALLGAAGLRDIGYYFPPDDPAYAGARSTELLARVVTLLAEAGYAPHNVDVMIIAETPRIGPHVDAMKEIVAPLLGIETSYLSIKATTHEGLGALGRREGIAAQAVATILEREELH